MDVNSLPATMAPMSDLRGFLIGLSVSMILGSGVVWGFHWMLTKRLNAAWGMKVPGWSQILEGERKLAVSPIITGLVERLVFTIAFAFYAEQTLTAMGAWLALKMATHWNKSRDKSEETNALTVDHYSAYGMLSLLSGLLSLAFAVAGGLIIRLAWGWGFTLKDATDLLSG
jgi:hypothetical protein